MANRPRTIEESFRLSEENRRKGNTGFGSAFQGMGDPTPYEPDILYPSYMQEQQGMQPRLRPGPPGRDINLPQREPFYMPGPAQPRAIEQAIFNRQPEPEPDFASLMFGFGSHEPDIARAIREQPLDSLPQAVPAPTAQAPQPETRGTLNFKVGAGPWQKYEDGQASVDESYDPKANRGFNPTYGNFENPEHEIERALRERAVSDVRPAEGPLGSMGVSRGEARPIEAAIYQKGAEADIQGDLEERRFGAQNTARTLHDKVKRDDYQKAIDQELTLYEQALAIEKKKFEAQGKTPEEWSIKVQEKEGLRDQRLAAINNAFGYRKETARD